MTATRFVSYRQNAAARPLIVTPGTQPSNTGLQITQRPGTADMVFVLCCVVMSELWYSRTGRISRESTRAQQHVATDYLRRRPTNTAGATICPKTSTRQKQTKYKTQLPFFLRYKAKEAGHDNELQAQTVPFVRHLKFPSLSPRRCCFEKLLPTPAFIHASIHSFIQPTSMQSTPSTQSTHRIRPRLPFCYFTLPHPSTHPIQRTDIPWSSTAADSNVVVVASSSLVVVVVVVVVVVRNPKSKTQNASVSRKILCNPISRYHNVPTHAYNVSYQYPALNV
mgnify:FL=1